MFDGQHFQNAYVCDDIEAGIRLFRERGLEKDPMIIPVEQEVSTPNGPVTVKNKLCFIWLNDLQYELIEPIEDPTGMYSNCLSNGGPLRFHHICRRVDNWEAFRKRVDEQDFPLVMERNAGDGQLKFLYLDGRKVFGHYLEYIWAPEETWKNMMAM